MEEPTYISAKAAGQALGVSERTARRWCVDGRLRSRRSGKAYEVEAASMEALKQEPASLDTAAGPAEPELPASEDEAPNVSADTGAGQASVPVAEAGAPVQVRVVVGEPRTELGQGGAEQLGWPEQTQQSAADELVQLRAEVQELRTRLAQEASTQQARSARADKTAANWWAWVQSEVARLGQESSAQQARSAQADTNAAGWWMWIQAEIKARTHEARVLQAAVGVLAAVAVGCGIALFAGKVRLDEDRDRLAFLVEQLSDERAERAALELRLVTVEAKANTAAQAELPSVVVARLVGALDKERATRTALEQRVSAVEVRAGEPAAEVVPPASIGDQSLNETEARLRLAERILWDMAHEQR